MKKVLGTFSGGVLENREERDKKGIDIRLSVLQSHYIALEQRIVQLEQIIKELTK